LRGFHTLSGGGAAEGKGVRGSSTQCPMSKGFRNSKHVVGYRIIGVGLAEVGFSKSNKRGGNERVQGNQLSVRGAGREANTWTERERWSKKHALRTK